MNGLILACAALISDNSGNFIYNVFSKIIKKGLAMASPYNIIYDLK
jgi:hypothetical protein